MESSINAITAVYRTHQAAEDAIAALARDGFDLQTLSIVGRDDHSEGHVVGSYHAGDRMRYWGRMGAFWGGVWSLLTGGAFLFVPGFGPLLIGGPLVGWMIAGLERAASLGGLSALGGALASQGIPQDSVLAYESDVKAGKYLVLVQCGVQQAQRARDILGAGAERLEGHQLPAHAARDTSDTSDTNDAALAATAASPAAGAPTPGQPSSEPTRARDARPVAGPARTEP